MKVDKSIGHAAGAVHGHEERDASIRGAMWFAAGLIATIIVVLALMRWLFVAFPKPQGEMAAVPYVQGLTQELPPEPRLQVHAPEDLKKMREQEDSMLDSYGWIDRQNGIVRIPVRRAMELLAERSSRSQTPSAAKPEGR